MIGAREAAAALYGIWRLVRCDENAFTFFNATVDGFWRSFTPAFVLAPLQAVFQFSLYTALEDPPNVLRMAAVSSLEYVILWLLFPLTMFYVARLLDRDEKYLEFIVAYNWFQLGINGLFMPLFILAGFSLLPPPLIGFVVSMSYVTFAFYTAFIARAGLAIPVGTAIGIVLINVLLNLFVTQITFRMM